MLHPRKTAVLIELNTLGFFPRPDCLVLSSFEDKYRIRQNFSSLDNPRNKLWRGSYVSMEYRSDEMHLSTKSRFSKKDSQLANEWDFKVSSMLFLSKRTWWTCLVPSRDWTFFASSLTIRRTSAVWDLWRLTGLEHFSKSESVPRQRWQGLVTANPCFTVVRFFASGISAQ